MSRKGKAKTCDEVKIRPVFMAEPLGPIVILVLLITLGLLGAYGFDLLSGWQVVALIATLVIPIVVALAILYRRNVRFRRSWSEHGSAEVEVGLGNNDKDDK